MCLQGVSRTNWSALGTARHPCLASSSPHARSGVILLQAPSLSALSLWPDYVMPKARDAEWYRICKHKYGVSGVCIQGRDFSRESTHCGVTSERDDLVAAAHYGRVIESTLGIV